ERLGLEPAQEPKLAQSILVEGPRQAVASARDFRQHRSPFPPNLVLREREHELVGLLPEGDETGAKRIVRALVDRIVGEVQLVGAGGFAEEPKQLLDEYGLSGRRAVQASRPRQ